MPDICIRDVCKSFDGRLVLDSLACRFPDGAVSCVTGPSGRGKTTLLRITAGLETPDSGTVSGMDSRKVGMVFQEDRLIGGMSAADNVRLTMSPALGEADLKAAFEQAGLGDSMDKAARELSGGMARRVALLRALLSDADVLLLDEPFKGLDEDLLAQIIRLTGELRHGRTCVLVTHDESEAEQLGAQVHIAI